NRASPGGGMTRQAEPRSPVSVGNGPAEEEGEPGSTSAGGSAPRRERTGGSGAVASGAEGAGEPASASPGSPSDPVDGESTGAQGDRSHQQTSGGDAGDGGSRDTTEADAEQAPALQLQAGFVPNGGAEIIDIDMDKIDLDDEEDQPSQEVVALSESID